MTPQQTRDPEPYLPSTREQWAQRVGDLTRELRRPEITPCAGELYITGNGRLQACISGIINDMAIRGGVPALWTDTEHPDLEDSLQWEVLPPPTNGANPQEDESRETTNELLPEAALYHGLNLEEGRHHVDAMDLDLEFRLYLNHTYGAALGYTSTPQLNDRWVQDHGANPLLAFADILDHMLQRPHTSFWHHRVYDWAQNKQH